MPKQPRAAGAQSLSDISRYAIWIDHFWHVDAELRRIIEDDQLLCHPGVIGELTLGSLRDRGKVIAFLTAQRGAVVATHDEVMMMIDRSRYFQHGHWLHGRPLAGLRSP
jgi:predicted nucleic acid-binding protein